MLRTAPGLLPVSSNPPPSNGVRRAVHRDDLTLRSRVEERELISRVLAGDPSAERALYDAHVDRVFRLVYRMAGDMDKAQDYTQETFIRAFSRLQTFRGDSALSTWLGSIAISVTLNGLRKVRRRNERELGLDEVVPVGHMVREAEPDLKVRLTQAIDNLPEGYRVV